MNPDNMLSYHMIITGFPTYGACCHMSLPFFRGEIKKNIHCIYETRPFDYTSRHV